MITRDACSILESAHETICSQAAQVGIDGARLLSDLPQPGTLLKGTGVPVLSTRDRGKASVVFHINESRCGTQWPFLQFQTFRHGGVTEQFHGLNWLRGHPEAASVSVGAAGRVAVDYSRRDNPSEEQARLKRHRALTYSYSKGTPLTSTHHWIHRRFAGWMTATVLERINGRHASNDRLLFPLMDQGGEHVGYQQIKTDGSNAKRFFLRASGLLAGSSVRISATGTDTSRTTVICEGIMTALAVARVWDGPVIAALTANNLRNVRSQIAGPVVIARDDDQWKPSIGNTGKTAAEAARQPSDQIVAPQFKPCSLAFSPTDFNDLLALEGLAAVKACFDG